MQALPFTFTNEAITIIIDGTPKVLHAGTAQYSAVKAQLMKDAPDWDQVRKSLTKGGAVESWLTGNGVEGFTVVDGGIQFNGEPLPNEFADRAGKMAAAGEDPSPLLRFFARLQKNPSKRSTDQLYTFLKHLNIPIEADGTFLAYKKVRDDLMDVHSGTIHNKPGKTITMPRNQISDDPNQACHEGLHVGALAYVKGFHTDGGEIIVVRVKPENVVCIPYDSNAEKMRVCEYEVVGYHTKPLPSTTVKDEDVLDEQAEEDEDLDNHIAQADDDGWTPPLPDDDEDLRSPAARSADAIAKQLPTATKRSQASCVGFEKMEPRKLLDQTIDGLRSYAKKLKIVGATKLPGGKVALVKAITKARKHK